MRHEPYQAFEGEVFTTSRKGIYSVHQRRGWKIVQLTERKFESLDEVTAWLEPQVAQLQVPGHRLFVRHDNDD